MWGTLRQQCRVHNPQRSRLIAVLTCLERRKHNSTSGRRQGFFFLFVYFIYLFILAVLGIRCCTRAFSSCGKWRLIFVAVPGLLIAVASLVRNTGAWAAVVVAHGLSSCGARAQLLRGMWDFPRPGIEPVSPALSSGFSTTAPPWKPHTVFY